MGEVVKREREKRNREEKKKEREEKRKGPFLYLPYALPTKLRISLFYLL